MRGRKAEADPSAPLKNAPLGMTRVIALMNVSLGMTRANCGGVSEVVG
jgi:hypothetical protein